MPLGGGKGCRHKGKSKDFAIVGNRFEKTVALHDSKKGRIRRRM